MNSYRLSLGGGQQAANRTSEPFYAVWNLESHPGTILEYTHTDTYNHYALVFNAMHLMNKTQNHGLVFPGFWLH